MNILVIATHPNIGQSKINRCWLEKLDKKDGVTVRFLDGLYKSHDEIDVESEKKFWESADRIVFQYPFYWYNMPSLMREYMDRVIQFGWAYGPEGEALKGKEFMCAISLGAPEYSFCGGGYNNFTLTEFLRPMQGTAQFLQMDYLPAFALYDAPRLREEEIERSAENYLEYIFREDLNYKKVFAAMKLKDGSANFSDL